MSKTALNNNYFMEFNLDFIQKCKLVECCYDIYIRLFNNQILVIGYYTITNFQILRLDPVKE